MSKPLFSIRIDDRNPRHTRLTVFNRGANAGTLVINTDDLDEFQKCLTAREWLRPRGQAAEYEVGDESPA